MPRPRAARKAPQQTSIEAIEKVALEMFAARGFEETPIEEIAAAAGISRRSFFRYFASKNDIPFGNNQALLHDLDQWLSSAPDDRPMFEVIAEATARFNRLHTDGPVAHRERMDLILHTPALRANATLVHAEWRAAVAHYAARRMGVTPSHFAAQLAGHVSHGVANAAYEEWLRDESSDLFDLIYRAFDMMQALRFGGQGVPASDAPAAGH